MGVESIYQRYPSYIAHATCIGVGNRSTRRKPLTYRKSLYQIFHKSCMKDNLLRSKIKLTALEAIGNMRVGSGKSYYHKIMSWPIDIIIKQILFKILVW